MVITTLNSCDLDKDTNRAMRSASAGPVFIAEHGRTTHVLLSIEDYQKLVDAQASIVEQLAMPGAEDVEFDPPRLPSS